MLAPEGCCLSRWLCTAEQVGRQVTTEKPKEKLPLTSIYPRVLVFGNLQLPSKNVSQYRLNKQQLFFLG